MRFLWISAVKDLCRLRRDPFSLAIWLGIPLLVGVLLSMVFGGGDATPQGRVLVADEDQTFLSNTLTGGFRGGPLSKMLVIEPVTQEDGRARMNRGAASALLIIPRGFQEAYLQDRPFQMELLTNPSQRILPKIVEESLSTMVDAGFYLHRITGGALKDLDFNQPAESMVLTSSTTLNRLIVKLRKYLNPPLIAVATSVVEEHKQNFATAFFPSMIFMAILFIANSLAGDIWRERMLGTLRRIAVSSVPLGAFLAGRLLFVAMVLCGIALIAIPVARWITNVPVANFPAAVLWLTFTGTALYLLFLLILLQASSQRAANMLGNMVIFPLAMLGGSFFPFESMPQWMASIGRLTPNGWALVQFRAILAGTATAASLANVFAAPLVVSTVAFLLALRRLRGDFLL